MPSIRVERVRELLKRELGEIIRRELPLSKAGMIIVNDVDVTKDLQLATVYAGVIGTAQQRRDAISLLEQHRKRIQCMVGRAVVLRYTPQLRFVLDESIERGNRVLKILEELDAPPSTHENSPKDH
ncbi:MAG: 30S ribosome-binding factor RbfA [Pedosphaera sp.]|nr:30S ribosome-binding factor RbfA [Pedosphaera sp.]